MKKRIFIFFLSLTLLMGLESSLVYGESVLDKVNKDLDSADRTIEQVERDIKDIGAKKKWKELQIGNHELEISNINSEIDRINSRITDENGKIEGAEIELSRRLNQYSALTDENRKAKLTEAATGERDQKVQAINRTIEGLQINIREKQLAIDGIRSKIEKINLEISDLGKEVDKKRQEISRLKLVKEDLKLKKDKILDKEDNFEYVLDKSLPLKEYEGFFVSATKKRLEIETYDGEHLTLYLVKDGKLLIDNRLVGLDDFKTGMEVFIRARGEGLVHMNGYSAAIPGYLEAENKLVKSRVKLIDRNQIKVLVNGEEKTYFTTPGTLVIRNGEASSLARLYEGDNIKIYLDDPESTTASKIEIEGESIEIKDLYKGSLKQVEKLTDRIYVDDVEKYKDGNWREISKGEKYKYNGKNPIYIGGTEVSQKNLPYYMGKDCYMAVKSNYGDEYVERMVLKDKYEKTYSDKIVDINWYTSQLELSNLKNINFTEGTMIIKNGRLVDLDSLNIGSDALVITEGKTGDQTATVIYIYDEDINNSNIGSERIYAGRLDEVHPETVNLKDYFVLNKHKWESFGDTREMYYDKASYIYDLDKGKKLTVEEFFAGGYAVDRTRPGRDRDHYAYIYGDEDRIVSIYIKKRLDPLERQRKTLGRIERKGSDVSMGDYILVENSMDYSKVKDQWMEKKAPIYIYLREAMIIKDGKRITKEELKPQDRLYILRDKNIAKLIVVK